MKKIICLFCSLLVLISFVACDLESGNSDADTTINMEDVNTPLNNYDIDTLLDTNGTFKYIVDEEGLYILDLPNSQNNIKIYLSNDCLKHLSEIDQNLFLEAGRKIFSNAEKDNTPHFEISVDSEKYLYLYGEIIIDIDPPNIETYNGEIVSKGCGIDHEHLYVRERISIEPISF